MSDSSTKPEQVQQIENKDSTLSFKQIVIRSSAWTTIGYGYSQVLRFGGNIILAYLLFPEAFGVMALVNVCLQGLRMFSDIGLGPSIIQNPDGEESSFLQTAWTIQIIRGFILWVGVMIIAWPASIFYDEPRLLYFLPVAGFTSFIGGFTSPNLFLATRRLKLRRSALFQIFIQTVSITIMIALAWWLKNIWALVISGVIGGTIRMILSHFVFSKPGMRIRFDRDAARQLIHFGKWIFFSTVLAFMVSKIDILIMGKYMSKGELGVYRMAIMIAGFMLEATMYITRQVLFPVYSKTLKGDKENIRPHTFRIRRILLLIALPPLWILIIWAPEIINLIYDYRYQGAGWMIQLLGIGTMLSIIIGPMDIILLASGNSRGHLLNLAARSSILLGALLIGGWYYGALGIIIGLVVAPILYYPFLIIMIRRYNVWLPRLDFAAFTVSALVIELGLLFKP